MKRFLIILPVLIVLAMFLFVEYGNKQTATPIPVTADSVSEQSSDLRDSLTASIKAIDSLRPVVTKTVQKLKELEELRDEYREQEAVIVYKSVNNTEELIALRRKLSEANSEILKLRRELSSANNRTTTMAKRDPYIEYVQPAVEVPDDNAVVITLDGSSRKGEIYVSENLTIYLLPYSRSLKRLMSYDSSCGDIVGEPAKYYKGVYFFNNVEPGKYIIKICTYMGNYKIIDKGVGKYNITMQVSPPIQ